jgi:SAM-dependent MidA family methyltransferase
MPAAHESAPPPSPAFLDAFRQRAAATGGTLSFADFMELALYHPELGYYRRDRPRVGRSATTDFYTASSSGSLFGELICAACSHLIGDHDPRSFTFVEIGAEPGGGILAGVAHPFAAARTIRVGEPLTLSDIAGPLIVFSNELFDAQPFRRFVARDGHWRELGVTLSADASHIVEAELPQTFPPSPSFSPYPSAALSSPSPVSPSSALPAVLPARAPEGYRLDLPLAAADLAAKIAAQPWTGLFVACDYGKSWRELTEATPHGTARAYHRHTQSNDLLARPGEQDLTCHVCWDWLADALGHHGFATPTVDSQESFLIHHAGDFISRITTAEAARLSPRKLSLMQLLHPANMGQKFQVLHAFRA